VAQGTLNKPAVAASQGTKSASAWQQSAPIRHAGITSMRAQPPLTSKNDRARKEGLVSGLSEFLQAFLHDSISSYEELETLLLLVRESERSWTDEELAEALKVPVDDMTTALDQLAAVEGLLEVDSQARQRRFQYAPKSKLLRQVVEELAIAYVDQRLAIVQLMSANALDRVRGAAARRLANAFRIREPKE
jgi:hypothetical protein